MLSLILIVVPVFGLIFIACELNQRLTDKFDQFDDTLWEIKWYLFPTKFQRFYLIFGSNTQQPVYIRGYGSIFFTRETFKKVIHFIRF